MLNDNLLAITQGWQSFGKVLYVPHSEADDNSLVSVLDQLIDLVGNDERHPLASLMDVIGSLIEQWENDNLPEFASDNE